MKKLLFVFVLFICSVSNAQTVEWYADGNLIGTTTCSTGDDITPPTPPVKNGYTFTGWVAYTPIEYLESTGTQWIDTGIVFSDGTLEIKTDVYFFEILSDGIDTFIMGNFNAITGFVYGMAKNNQSYFYTAGKNHGFIQTKTGKNTMHAKMAWNNKIEFFKFNGTETVTNFTVSRSFYNAENSINIFKRPDQDKAKFLYPNGIGKTQIYQNDILVRDFIPVLDGNGIPCMYDKVEGKFYYNAGTGQFVAGPVVGDGGE